MNRRVRAKHFTVHGRVQGVGYRFFVCHAARGLSLTGWVRNLPNGDVEVVAEGEEDRLGELARQLKAGPMMARVTSVDEQPASIQNYSDFTIRG